MSFLAPIAFSLFALSVAVIVLYILKVRRRPVTVPYLRLWETLIAETRTRSLFKRLKRLLSLLLQLLILACVIFALTQPSLDLDTIQEEHIVLILDASASMNAIEDDESGRTRFDILMEKAGELVEDRSHEDSLMIVEACDRIRVLSPFARNTIKLREALAQARPTHRSLDVARAYAFAQEVTRDLDNPVIIFLSDGSAGAIEKVIEGADRAHLLLIGTPRDNVGIVRFSARKNESLGTDYVIAQVKNFGAAERELHFGRDVLP